MKKWKHMNMYLKKTDNIFLGSQQTIVMNTIQQE